MLNWEGNKIDKSDRQQFLLFDIEEDVVMAASVQIFSMEMRAVETVMDSNNNDYERPLPMYRPPHVRRTKWPVCSPASHLS